MQHTDMRVTSPCYDHARRGRLPYIFKMGHHGEYGSSPGRKTSKKHDFRNLGPHLWSNINSKWSNKGMPRSRHSWEITLGRWKTYFGYLTMVRSCLGCVHVLPRSKQPTWSSSLDKHPFRRWSTTRFVHGPHGQVFCFVLGQASAFLKSLLNQQART